MPNKIALKHGQRLVLQNKRLTSRLHSLFAELAEDETLQRNFLESPAEVLGCELQGRPLAEDQAAAVNRFMYSALANDKFTEWAASYDRDNPGVDKTQAMTDLATMLTQCGDPKIIGALLEMADRGVSLEPYVAASILIKAESVAIGNWFIVKVSGHTDELGRVLPADQIQLVSQQLVAQAQQLELNG